MNNSNKLKSLPKLNSKKKMVNNRKGFDRALASLGVSVLTASKQVKVVA